MLLDHFTYNGQPGKVLFGPGSLSKVRDEVDRLGAERALVLSTPDQREQAEGVCLLLGSKAAGVFDRAVMHVPIETAVEAGAEAKRLGAECLVTIGGGSTTGLGKAIALVTGLPILAIPTTYAGSEMTTIYGITENGLKKTGKDPRVLPKVVIYDPELTLGLPVGLSVTSGLNAIAHCAEGLYAQDSNPVMTLIAEEGIRSVAAGLAKIRETPTDIEARAECLYGAWLSGIVLGNVGVALHHKLCHTLGGSFNLAHADTHAVVLPHAIAYNAPAVPDAALRTCRALNASDGLAGAALYDLAARLGAPTSLKAIGMAESDLDRAADIALANPYWNPRTIDRTGLRTLLQEAFEGARPTA